jgi:2-oxoglutarate dehydrogenase E2 component (dihydrolipoamide succinyltransferase)
MAIVDVKVPQLSESVAEATLLQWKKKPGEAVAMDEILVEIETDKVVLEVPAPAAGWRSWSRATARVAWPTR